MDSNKIKIYLSGPIDLLECKGQNWRQKIIEKYRDKADFIDPPINTYKTLDELISGDLSNITKSDVLLWNALPGPSHGSSMEAFYTKTILKKPVVLVCHDDWKPQWPRWTASAVYDSTDKAMSEILNCHEERQKLQKFVVVLAGPKRAGKDTFADLILKEIGFGEKISFASPLKKVAKELFYIPSNAEDNKDNYLLTENLTYRKFLQDLGYDLVRHVDRQLIIDNLIRRIESSRSRLFVVSDCRLQVEAETLKSKFKNNCLIFKILRDEALKNLPEDKHITEQEWYKIKAHEEVSNDSTLCVFKEQCKYFISHYDSLRKLKDFSTKNILDRLII